MLYLKLNYFLAWNPCNSFKNLVNSAFTQRRKLSNVVWIQHLKWRKLWIFFSKVVTISIIMFSALSRPARPNLSVSASTASRPWHGGKTHPAPCQPLPGADSQDWCLSLWYRHQAWETASEGQQVNLQQVWVDGEFFCSGGFVLDIDDFEMPIVSVAIIITDCQRRTLYSRWQDF